VTSLMNHRLPDRGAPGQTIGRVEWPAPTQGSTARVYREAPSAREIRSGLMAAFGPMIYMEWESVILNLIQRKPARILDKMLLLHFAPGALQPLEKT
jgi:hypothetical protein